MERKWQEMESAESTVKKSVNFFIVVCLLLSSLSAKALEPAWSPTDDAKLFPPCYDNRKRSVKFERTASRADGPAFAAVTTDGDPIVLFNIPMLAMFTTSEDSQRFIYLHECGHCELGHIYQDNREQTIVAEEFAADCYAAKRARALGLNLKKILKDVAALPGEPAGLDRARRIERCYLGR